MVSHGELTPKPIKAAIAIFAFLNVVLLIALLLSSGYDDELGGGGSGRTMLLVLAWAIDTMALAATLFIRWWNHG